VADGLRIYSTVLSAAQTTALDVNMATGYEMSNSALML
jgi:hypothetical protein